MNGQQVVSGALASSVPTCQPAATLLRSRCHACQEVVSGSERGKICLYQQPRNVPVLAANDDDGSAALHLQQIRVIFLLACHCC